MTGALMSKALAGDDAGARRVDRAVPRRELLVHCYRMLGVLPRRRRRPAGDTPRLMARASRVRGTLVAAHVVVPDRHEPLPQRPTCRHDARPSTGTCPTSNPPSRPGSAKCHGSSRSPTPSSPARAEAPNGPEARDEQQEAISLAFVTALQLLPPRQVAVLILRDVLGYHADEVADMLGSSSRVSQQCSQASTRGSLQQHTATVEAPPPVPGSPAEKAILTGFVESWQSADLDALVKLLTDDVFMSMPPMPFEYEGRAIVARFCASIFDAARRFDLVPTRLPTASPHTAPICTLQQAAVRELEAISPLPMLNAIPEVAAEIGRRKLKTVGILGTRMVMETRLYGSIASAAVVVPEGEALDEVHKNYAGNGDGGSRHRRATTAYSSRKARNCAEIGARKSSFLAARICSSPSRDTIADSRCSTAQTFTSRRSTRNRSGSA